MTAMLLAALLLMLALLRVVVGTACAFWVAVASLRRKQTIKAAGVALLAAIGVLLVVYLRRLLGIA